VNDVYVYSMTPEALNEARQFAGIDVLIKILGENGFQTKVPGIVAGPTKEVVFSLVASKGARTVAIDLAQSSLEVEIQPVLELYVKVLEASPNVAILGVIPTLSKRARDVAELHKILVAEGSTPNELAARVIQLAEAG
jgi:hypothetical protein